jgi:hypothetical protein
MLHLHVCFFFAYFGPLIRNRGRGSNRLEVDGRALLSATELQPAGAFFSG